jgi:hypothetical protein
MAKNEREAFLHIDPIVGEPDMASLKELRAPGFVDFSVNFRDGTVQFLPPKEDV